jgi:hypothetical protein
MHARGLYLRRVAMGGAPVDTAVLSPEVKQTGAPRA